MLETKNLGEIEEEAERRDKLKTDRQIERWS